MKGIKDVSNENTSFSGFNESVGNEGGSFEFECIFEVNGVELRVISPSQEFLEKSVTILEEFYRNGSDYSSIGDQTDCVKRATSTPCMASDNIHKSERDIASEDAVKQPNTPRLFSGRRQNDEIGEISLSSTEEHVSHIATSPIFRTCRTHFLYESTVDGSKSSVSYEKETLLSLNQPHVSIAPKDWEIIRSVFPELVQ